MSQSDTLLTLWVYSEKDGVRTSVSTDSFSISERTPLPKSLTVCRDDFKVSRSLPVDSR